MKGKRRPRDVVRVRVSEDQAPMFHVPGKDGGWFLSLLWNYGHGLDIPLRELRRLLAGSKGEIVIARRLTGNDLRFFDEYRKDIDHEVHARLIFKDAMRWRSPRKR